MNQPFSFQTRERSLSYLKNRAWDVLVIGGGITGAAVARDAVLRGLTVALVDAHDFASGTSSGSTKLIHGGLRYLENFEFKLVSEAIHEREKLRALYAPFVRDLRFVFPTYRGKPPARWKLNIGLFLYDAFSSFRERHQNLSAEATKSRFKFLKAEGLTGSCIYIDSFAEDYRLVVELIKSAHRHGAICLNQVSVFNLHSTQDEFTKVDVKDHISGEKFSVSAKTIFNCSGPYSDRIRAFCGLPPTLTLTQGVHFLIPHSKLPISEAFVLSDPELHRILFAIPWGNSTYFGTTDTSIPNPEDAQAQLADLRYVLKIVNGFFKSEIHESDVYQSWAGVRPLITPQNSHKSNSAISREHLIEESPPGIFHILGGKLTSHRSMAAEAMDLAAKSRGWAAGRTDKLPLQDALWDSDPNCEFAHLPKTYGRFYSDVLRIDREMGLHHKLISKDFPVLESEVLYCIHFEMALNAIDFLRRRTNLYYQMDIENSSHRDLLKEINEVFARELSWNAEVTQQRLKEAVAVFNFDRKGYRQS